MKTEPDRAATTKVRKNRCTTVRSVTFSGITDACATDSSVQFVSSFAAPNAKHSEMAMSAQAAVRRLRRGEEDASLKDWFTALFGLTAIIC